MKKFSIMLLFFLLIPVAVSAKEDADKDGAKMISGMSVVGNKDAPKSLYIVPWKSSEIGVKTDLKSSLLNEDMVPVDKPEFMRELDFYNVSTEKKDSH